MGKSSIVTVQRVKQCCDAMNCKTELDFTEIDKYFGQVGSLFALPIMATIKSDELQNI